MTVRRKNSRETWHRLLEWDKSSSDAERLAGIIISTRGYENVDPQHPLGGPDGTKDFVCLKSGKKYIAAVYFPRGETRFKDIKDKFTDDMVGISKHAAEGFIFVTNQELRIGEREDLEGICTVPLDLIHLESLNTILNNPIMYGIRLDFLDLEMEKEEQISFMQQSNETIVQLKNVVAKLVENQQANSNPVRKGAVVVEAKRVHDNFSAGIVSSHYEKYHVCGKCKYGYIVSYANPMFVHYSDGRNTSVAICPECGNAEPIGGIWF